MSRDTEHEPTPVPKASGACVACGTPSAQSWDTADGRIAMCPPCAVMNGIGCP